MSLSESSSQHNGSYSKQLFDLLYYFPATEEDLKDFKKIDSTIRQIILTIKKLQKNNVDQIQRVCNTNKKLQIISKFLFNQKLYILVMNLFTHLVLSSKLLNFIIKINVPLIIYKNLIRVLEKDCQRGKNKMKVNEKDKEIEQSFKFIYQYSKIQPKKFPRSFANLVSNILAQQIIGKSGTSFLTTLIFDISIEILRNNFTLAAESQILQNIYNKTIAGDIDIDRTRIVMEIIVCFCNSKQTRDIVLGCIDLGKAFARFNNVDLRLTKQGSSTVISSHQIQEKLIKSCLVIETLLSSWSTLIYFIIEKSSLINFINGLARKTTLQIEIIKTHILKKIIIRTLTYNKNRMLKSLNLFGYKSNYLNYRGLVLINFMLKNDSLYETFQSISNQGELMQSLSSLCLQYFPHISENQKYSKKIIKNIKFPRHYQTFIAKQAYKKKLQSYNQEILLSLKSYCKPSLISYYFEPKQLRNYLIWLKQDREVFNSFSQQLKEQIQINLQEVKIQSQSCQFLDKNKILALLANFYKVGIHASFYIPWRGENLKFSKFLSSILEYLINCQYNPIFNILIRTLKNMFESPKVKYCRYLICSILDDFGKFLPTMEECQSLILNNFKNDDYSFLISKILLNIDYEKSTDKFNKSKFQTQMMSPKKILQYICTKQGSDYVVLQIIEVIKNIYYDNIQRNQHEPASLIELVSNHLVYSKNQEIISACLEFFQEAVITKSGSLQKYVKMIKLDKIKTDYHRKRFAFLFLVYEGGFQIVTELYPQLFKEQLQNWINKGSPTLKEYTNFMMKQVKRFNNVYTKQKEGSSYLFLGFQEQERQNLLNLPWNIMINDECYPALAQYKNLKQKLKLRVRVSKIIEPQMTISVLNIGMNSFGKESNELHQNLDETLITIRLQEIIKSFQKNKNKQSKEQPLRFAVTKQQVTLFFTIDQNQNFILQKLNINIHLEKKIYRPLLYPYNFISLLTMTKSGMDFLKKQKTFQKIMDKINASQNNFQILKQNLIFLGCYCSGYRQLKDSIQKKDFYEGLMKGFWKTYIQTTNFQIKQICHWIMNVLIKDEDFQSKVKSQKQKKGKFVETKYCGTLYYYHYCPSQGLNRQFDEYDSLLFLKQQMPEKLTHEAEFKEIYEDLLNNQQKQRQFLNLNRIDELRKKQCSNPKVFQNIMKYMSLINYGCFKVHLVFQMYQRYLASSKFQHDFPNGFPLP